MDHAVHEREPHRRLPITLALTLAPLLLVAPAGSAAVAAAAVSACVAAGPAAGLGGVEVVASHDAERPRPIASLAKLMLELLVVEAVESGRFVLDAPIAVSPAAARARGATAGLAAGRAVPAGRLLRLAALDSANDAAVALAEGLCGSEAACAERMNRRAAALGLTATRFANVTGLPAGAGREPTVASACDLARLGVEALRHPLVPTARRRGGGRLLHVLKTGASREAGYGLVAAEDARGRRVVAILGASSDRARFEAAARWLGRARRGPSAATRSAGAGETGGSR